MRLLNAATAVVDGSFRLLQQPLAGVYGVAQVAITGTATVVIEGRTAPDMPWFTLLSTTASTLDRVTLTHQMRARVTAIGTGGSVTVEVVE